MVMFTDQRHKYKILYKCYLIMSVTDINNLCLFLNLYCAFLFKEFKKDG